MIEQIGQFLGSLTGIGAIVTAYIAVSKFFEDKKAARMDRSEQRFIELSKRASSTELLELVNAVCVLPVFAKNKLKNQKFKTVKQYYNLINDFNIYLKEVIWLIINILLSNSREIDEGKKHQINNACVQSLSEITHLTKIKFYNTYLSYISLDNAIIDGISLPYIYLQGASFKNAKLKSSNFYKADLSFANFIDAKLTDSNLEKVKFYRTNLFNADLSNSIFSEYGGFPGIKLEKCNLIKTKFDRVKLKDGEFLNNKLKGASFEEASLHYTRFGGCNLTDANFCKAKAENVRFEFCNLETSCFLNADLSGATFRKCNLFCANLMGANITYVKFIDCDFTSINFNGAIYNKYLYEKDEYISKYYKFVPLTKDEWERFIKRFPEMEERQLSDDFGHLLE